MIKFSPVANDKLPEPFCNDSSLNGYLGFDMKQLGDLPFEYIFFVFFKTEHFSNVYTVCGLVICNISSSVCAVVKRASYKALDRFIVALAHNVNNLHWGRNRQIRKMCESLGLEVARLKRTSMGSLKLGMLPVGKWRELKEDEVHKLMISSGMKVNKF